MVRFQHRLPVSDKGGASETHLTGSRQAFRQLLAVELDNDEPLKRGRATADVIKSHLAARAAFPLIRINAYDTYTPAALRQKPIVEYNHAKSGPLPVEMV